MKRRNALITGASRGLGAAIALGLAEAGFDLTISARGEPGLVPVAQAAQELGSVVHMHAANLRNDPEIEGLVAAHAAAFGGVLDLLVVNAGMGYTDTLAELPVGRFDTIMKINLRSPFLLIQGALPLLRAAAAARAEFGGKVIAVSSLTAIASEVGLGAYGASKAGLTSLCQTLTIEEWAHGVSASVISPGYVATDMTTHLHETLPHADMMTPADVATLVVAMSKLSAHASVPDLPLTRPGSNIWRA
jgi:3-oxoacyl-[acyl-carrier protein] reductase